MACRRGVFGYRCRRRTSAVVEEGRSGTGWRAALAAPWDGGIGCGLTNAPKLRPRPGVAGRRRGCRGEGRGLMAEACRLGTAPRAAPSRCPCAPRARAFWSSEGQSGGAADPRVLRAPRAGRWRCCRGWNGHGCAGTWRAWGRARRRAVVLVEGKVGPSRLHRRVAVTCRWAAPTSEGFGHHHRPPGRLPVRHKVAQQGAERQRRRDATCSSEADGEQRRAGGEGRGRTCGGLLRGAASPSMALAGSEASSGAGTKTGEFWRGRESRVE